MTVAILWFRSDLRTGDNAALVAACHENEQLLPIYILDTRAEMPWVRGSASRWWLHHGLEALDATLRALGNRLIVRAGDSVAILTELARKIGARRLYVNRRYEPHLAAFDERCRTRLAQAMVEMRQYSGALLYEPESVQNRNGEPYRVFTPFWKAVQRLGDERQPLPAPSSLPPAPTGVTYASIDSLELLPKIGWDAGLSERWTPGETSAKEKLSRFLEARCTHYETKRDLPGVNATSALSPHLTFGEITPREIAWHLKTGTIDETKSSGALAYLRQLAWREFAYHLLHHFPDTADHPMDKRFRDFAWSPRPEETFPAWRKGETGIPLVDAGMRELWCTGTMHNRARMVAASFLTKNLLIPWQEGARWFWDTLVDADLANNTLGWQWVAGCGVDAAPYFRIFNPVRQGERFDPEGEYVRRWIPALRQLDKKWIHQPWQAPAAALKTADLRLGDDYPLPIVDLSASRARALLAYQAIKTSGRAAS